MAKGVLPYARGPGIDAAFSFLLRVSENHPFIIRG